MNENQDTFEIPVANKEEKTIVSRVGEVANVQIVPSDPSKSAHNFAAKTISSGTMVLVQVKLVNNTKAKVTVNCEKMVIGNMLLKDLKNALLRV